VSDKPHVIPEDLENALEHMGTSLDVTFDDLWRVVNGTLDQARRRKDLFASREFIRDIMTSPVVTCAPGAGIVDAAELLLTHDIHCLPVVENGTLAGIVTESDLIYQFSPESGESPLHHLFFRKRAHRPGHTVGEVMTREVVAVHPEDSIETAVHVLLKHGFGRLPVVDGDHRVVGIVARRDLLRFVR